MPAVDAPGAGFAATLRAATAPGHADAEQAGVMRRLVAGELPATGYARLLVQLRAVYASLESLNSRWRDDAVVGWCVDDRLLRLDAIDADLTWFADRGVAVDERLTPATRAYAARLTRTAATDAGAFVAHHYTRYLGDLSGGQHIGRVVSRTFGGGNAMTTFPDIDDPRAFKQRYRACLDALPWDPSRRAAVVAEVAHAYALNAGLLADLDRETSRAGVG